MLRSQQCTSQQLCCVLNEGLRGSASGRSFQAAKLGQSAHHSPQQTHFFTLRQRLSLFAVFCQCIVGATAGTFMFGQSSALSILPELKSARV